MANGYSKKFTLEQLFSDKELADKLPMIGYKDNMLDMAYQRKRYGKTINQKQSTKVKSIPQMLFQVSKRSAKPYYKPLNAIISDNRIEIGGTLVGDFDECYLAVYNAVVSSKSLLKFAVENTDMIREAIKESNKVVDIAGVPRDARIYLKQNSINEIKSLKGIELWRFQQDIMDNIRYSDKFVGTQDSFGIKGMSAQYNKNKIRWQNKVGELENEN